MVSRTAEGASLKTIKYFADAVYDYTLTKNDTFILTDFVDTENPKFVAIINKSTGAEVTCSYNDGNNIVTVEGDGTDMQCRVYAFGVKA